ncbi:MAG: hypothetical protein TE42_10305 [Candidatus Synechococcus spongiarum SP3]|uniref:Uncharacterized protein n=1 Tax=Candidatus Synechococcus spongiarum SP3 TaxID=1604020 RepID=A0A0G2J3Y9_9SYNE|nr:MAG: hypothetical protein TE42_10305 [Candidatus Synechococcus spongiarum SP3]
MANIGHLDHAARLRTWLLVGSDGSSRYDAMSDQPTVGAAGKLGLGFILILRVMRDPGYDLPAGRDDFTTITREKEVWGNGLANPPHQVIVFSAFEQFLPDPINTVQMPT